MYLKLAVAGNVIASVPLNSNEVSNLEYVYAKRSMLAEACCNILSLQKETPVYYIEVPSKMNKGIKK